MFIAIQCGLFLRVPRQFKVVIFKKRQRHRNLDYIRMFRSTIFYNIE